jgi:hypothetical protein
MASAPSLDDGRSGNPVKLSNSDTTNRFHLLCYTYKLRVCEG